MQYRILAVSVAAAGLAVGAAACSSSPSSSAPAAAAPSSAAASNPMPALSAPMASSPASAAGASTPTSDFGSACSSVPTPARAASTGWRPRRWPPPPPPTRSCPPWSPRSRRRPGGHAQQRPGHHRVRPGNAAFAKIPAATLTGVLADQAELTKILTYHVVSGRLTPAQLAGTHTTLEGGTITVAGSGENFTVTGGSASNTANVICGNVQTANATVYIIDSVLMPK